MICFTTRLTHNKHVKSQPTGLVFSPIVTLSSIFWTSSWLLEFDALLDSSTDTRHLSAVSLLLPTNLTDLENNKTPHYTLQYSWQLGSMTMNFNRLTQRSPCMGYKPGPFYGFLLVWTFLCAWLGGYGQFSSSLAWAPCSWPSVE